MMSDTPSAPPGAATRTLAGAVRRERRRKTKTTKMNSEDTRNLFLAIALSVLVMAGWQYFYAGRCISSEHQAQTQANSQQTVSEASRALRRRPSRRPAAASLPGARVAARDDAKRRSSAALAASPRVSSTRQASAARSISGAERSTILSSRTIARRSTRRARMSDCSRRPARPTPIGPRPDLSARPGPRPPNLDTVWTADRQTLTPTQPVTLTWDNGEGLLFKRVIAVDDKYMFTITDSVVN